MSKISQEAAVALLSKRPFIKSNTAVIREGYNYAMFLYGNKIAEVSKKGITIATCGCNTVTKSRLNALPNIKVVHKKGQLFLNGHEWDGSPILVPFI